MDKRTILFILCLTTSFFAIDYYFNQKQKAAWQQEYPQKVAQEAPVKEKTSPKAEISSLASREKKTTNQQAEEKFFVIENEYQQLVFSNYGGALAEINLPFQSKSNPKSAVKETEIDRLVKEQAPKYAQFPSKTFYLASLLPGNNFQKINPTLIGGYYPLIRRNFKLAEEAERKGSNYYSCNIISDKEDLSKLVYDIKEFNKNKIVFEAIQPYREIRKTYSLISNGTEDTPYCLELTIEIEGDRSNLWLTSGIPEVELMSGYPVQQLKYQILRQGKPETTEISLPKESKKVITNTSINPDWINNSNNFFNIILDPLSGVKGYKVEYVSAEEQPSRLLAVTTPSSRSKPLNSQGYHLLLSLDSAKPVSKFRIYAGPLSSQILKKIDQQFADPAKNYSPNYVESLNTKRWFGFISVPFSKLLLVIMEFCYKLTHSWGISIILLTVVLRVILFPLNSWAMRSAKRMQQLAPKVTSLQAKYKKDPKKLQIEIMELYRREKANPFSGCVPILVQMPFLIGMFDLLRSNFELRGASFIPGWIDNLASPDVLFSWNFHIPFIGHEFHFMPILLGAVMFLQQKLSAPSAADQASMTDQQRQQQFISNIMVVFFSILFYHFPAGLNIYWLSSTLLGIAQQKLINRKMDQQIFDKDTISIKVTPTKK